MTGPTLGTDISKDGLDAHRWPDGASRRFANAAKGHKARRFAEASGKHAKTDRIDAEMLARLGALLEPQPRAPMGSKLEGPKALRLARAALVKDRTAARTRAPHLALPLFERQNARRRAAIADDLVAIDEAIAALIDSDEGLARAAAILCSMPGLSAVTAAAIRAEMSELGSLEPGAASRAGVAPVTRPSGRWTGRAAIRGGRAGLRRALYLPALSAARFNPSLAARYRALRAAGNPPKLALVAIMRKLLLLANALLRDRRTWSPNAP